MFAGMFEEEDSEPFIGPLHINSSSSSTIYHSFVSSDVKVKADSGFVGLLNQGSTCYLNSLLQTLFLTPEFRNSLYSLSSEEIGFDLDQEKNETKEESKKQEEKNVEISDEVLTNLLSMGFNFDQIEMAAKTCGSGYNLDSILNILVEGDSNSFSFDPPIDDDLFLTPRQIATRGIKDYDEAPYSLDFGTNSNINDNEMEDIKDSDLMDTNKEENPKQPPKKRKIIINLLKLFSELELLDIEAISTKDLTDSFGWTSRDSLEQHDVHELNRILSSAIEESLKGTSQEKLISNLYGGVFENSTLCLTCNTKNSRNEDYVDISLVIQGHKNIKSSLEALTAPESMTGDDQYFCDTCNKRVDAERRTEIKSLPPILTFSLLRFAYDFKMNRRMKITSHYEFPHEIDISPYVSEELRGEDCVYNIFSIVIHGGDAYGGHYHAFISPIGQNGQTKWFDFNDSKVEEINPNLIESQFKGSESAYMLVYRRKNQPSPQQSSIPSYLSPFLESRLMQLEEKRLKIEESKNSIRVFIDIESHYRVVDGGILEDNLRPSKEVVIDSRNTILDLKRLIKNAYSEYELPDIDEMKFQKRFSLRSDPKFGLEVLEFDDDAIIRDCGISDRDIYLCWNGKTISNVPWDGATKSFEIPISYYKSLLSLEVITISMSEYGTLGDLKSKLEKEIGISKEDLTIFHKTEDLPVLLEETENQLTELISKDTFILTVEKKKPSWGEYYVVHAALQKDQPNLFKDTVYVIDRTSSSWHATYTLEYDTQMTIEDLKKTAITEIMNSNYTSEKSHIQLKKTRLRRTLLADADGPLFIDETLTLEKAGVKEGDRMILELGETVSSSLLPYRYVFHSSQGITSKIKETTINRASSLFECKMEIAVAEGKSPTEIKMFWLDSWESKGEPVENSDDDLLLNLKGPDGTLACMNEHGITFWIEEKGNGEELWLFHIDCFYSQFPLLSNGTNSTNGFSKIDGIAKDPAFVSTSTPCCPNDQDIFHLTSFSLPSTTTAKELKKKLFEQSYVKYDVTSEDKMRFWYKQAPIPFEKESLPLKKLHFKNGKRLCLQFLYESDALPDFESLGIEPQTRTIFFIAHRNPEKQEFDWMKEFHFYSNIPASWEELVEQLSTRTEIPKEFLSVGYYDRKKRQEGSDTKWIAINDPHLKLLGNIFTHPWKVSNGDILGFRDLREAPENVDKVSSWNLNTLAKSLTTFGPELPSRKRNAEKSYEAVLKIHVS